MANTRWCVKIDDITKYNETGKNNISKEGEKIRKEFNASKRSVRVNQIGDSEQAYMVNVPVNSYCNQPINISYYPYEGSMYLQIESLDSRKPIEDDNLEKILRKLMYGIFFKNETGQEEKKPDLKLVTGTDDYS